MSYDALTMHAIRDELESRLVGGRIDNAYLIDNRQVGLDLYAHAQRQTLVLSLDPSDSRIYLSSERVARGTDRVTPFLLLLRKYVRGSHLVALEQPRLERVLTLRLSSRPDAGLPRDIELVAEAMGRRSNLLLLDEDGTIMDALERVPHSVNPSRPLLPHLRYTPPPAESKLDPRDPTLGFALEEAGRASNGPAASLIVREVAGMSPLTAREALHRAQETIEVQAAEVASWQRVAASLASLAEPLETRQWTPSIAWEGDRVLEYAAFEISQYPSARVETAANMSTVVERAGARAVRVPRYDRLKRPLLDALGARAEQARRKRSSLERSLSAADDADALRWAGEAILANVAQIAPDSVSLEWEGRRIDLYPTLTPAENAQAYFRRYADARDAKRVVPPLIEETSRELEYLDEMALHVEIADSERDLNVLRRELEATGVLREARGKSKQRDSQRARGKPPTGLYRRFSVDGNEILAGTSAVGNEMVTFGVAGPNDLWFHVRGGPGAHVILRNPGRDPSPQIIEAAARLAAAHSALREELRADVVYTPRRHVRKIAGAAPGQVTYRGETTVSVRPEMDKRAAAARSA